MTIDELIELLEEAKEEIGDEFSGMAEVRFAHQPSWPFELAIAQVTVDTGSDGVGMDEDGYPTSLEDERDAVVYLVEERQIGYLPEHVKDELGW